MHHHPFFIRMRKKPLLCCPRENKRTGPMLSQCWAIVSDVGPALKQRRFVCLRFCGFRFSCINLYYIRISFFESKNDFLHNFWSCNMHDAAAALFRYISTAYYCIMGRVRLWCRLLHSSYIAICDIYVIGRIFKTLPHSFRMSLRRFKYAQQLELSFKINLYACI